VLEDQGERQGALAAYEEALHCAQGHELQNVDGLRFGRSKLVQFARVNPDILILGDFIPFDQFVMGTSQLQTGQMRCCLMRLPQRAWSWLK
jgi:hypothetical protein